MITNMTLTIKNSVIQRV